MNPHDPVDRKPLGVRVPRVESIVAVDDEVSGPSGNEHIGLVERCVDRRVADDLRKELPAPRREEPRLLGLKVALDEVAGDGPLLTPSPWKLSLAVNPSRRPPAPGSGPPPVRLPDGISGSGGSLAILVAGCRVQPVVLMDTPVIYGGHGPGRDRPLIV
jgi:hypothetical protein